VDGEVERLQENNFSVYTAASLCALLEKAGAIRRVTEKGTEYSQVKVEPTVVEVDGVEYCEAGTPPPASWPPLRSTSCLRA
jgi:SOS-response transcriptional repressor LexA